MSICAAVLLVVVVGMPAVFLADLHNPGLRFCPILRCNRIQEFLHAFAGRRPCEQAARLAGQRIGIGSIIGFSLRRPQTAAFDAGKLREGREAVQDRFPVPESVRRGVI